MGHWKLFLFTTSSSGREGTWRCCFSAQHISYRYCQENNWPHHTSLRTLTLPVTLASFCPIYMQEICTIQSEVTTEHGTGCFSFREAHCPSKISSCWFPVKLRGETGRFLPSCVIDDASFEGLHGTFTAISNTGSAELMQCPRPAFYSNKD